MQENTGNRRNTLENIAGKKRQRKKKPGRKTGKTWKRRNEKKTIDRDKRVRMKQQKITTQLAKLPENRRIMLERELETERKLNLKEAKEELWRRWRQKKGRTEYKKKTKKEEEETNLERKLESIEQETTKYENEIETEMVEILEKAENKEKKIEKRNKKNSTGRC